MTTTSRRFRRRPASHLREVVESNSSQQVIARLVDAVEKTGFSPSLAKRASLDSQASELRGRLQQTRTTVPIEVMEEFCAKAQVTLKQGGGG